MFDLSWSHIVILLGVLLVVVGPKDLPRLMHMVGQWAGKARRMANEFKKSFDDMARQEELDKLRIELDNIRKAQINVPDLHSAVSDIDLPPINDIRPPEPRSGEFQVTETAPHVSTEHAPVEPVPAEPHPP